MVDTAKIIWADGPSGTPTQPAKSLIRAWGTWLENTTTALGLAVTAAYIRGDRSQLFAISPATVGLVGVVVADEVEGFRGIYVSTGSSWEKRLDLPVDAAQILAEQAEDARDLALDYRNSARTARDEAEDARDIAAGYASDAVSQGNVPVYATAAGMPSITVPAGINSIRVNGKTAAGDGNGGLYVSSANGSKDAFLSGGGTARTWYKAPDVNEGSFALVAPYLGQIASPTRIATEFFTTNKQIMSRTVHSARDNISSLQLIFPNWYVGGNPYQEVAPGASATLTASIEYPKGVFNQLKFSGSATATISDGGQATNDALAINIPDGATFWVRTFYRNTAGIIYTDKVAGAGNYAVSGLSDLTMTGEVVDGFAEAFCYGPCAIIGMTNKPTIGLLGDSRASGEGDLLDDTCFTGNVMRSLGGRLAVLSLSRNGDRASRWVDYSVKRKALLQYVSHIVVEYGINDIMNAGADAATVKTRLETIIADIAKPAYIVTLEPWTTSTDAWATVANQAVTAAEAERLAHNANVRSGNIAGAIGFFEIADAVESSRNSGKWKAPGYTADGQHSTQLGYRVTRDSGAVDGARIRSLLAPPRSAKPSQALAQSAGNVWLSPESLRSALDMEGRNDLPTVYGDTTAGTCTYSVRGSQYTKIGRLVFFLIALEWSGHTGTGFLRVGGLPYKNLNSRCPVTVVASSMAYSFQLIAQVESYENYIVLQQQAAATAIGRVPMTASGMMNISGCYHTSD